MPKFIINGGKRLAGSIEVSSAKNSALALICASLLVKGRIVLRDVPQIEEVKRLIEVLQSINVKCDWLSSHDLAIDSSAPLQMEKINQKICAKMRSSLLLLGALSHRVPKYKLYKTGGCKLGERSVRPHLYALEVFGVEVKSAADYYDVKNTARPGAEIVMYESGDTPTENVIMSAVLAPGQSIIKFVSSNYMTQDLCFFLQKMGAKISGIGTTTLTIHGVSELKPIKEYFVMPDPIVAMTWISLAITTKSELTIKNCPLDFLELELEKLKVMGQKFELKNKRKSKNKKFNIVDIIFFPSPLMALPDKIYGRPFPGLNIDNLPLFVPILTQAKGRTLVHDWVYENRAVYYLDFQKIGAKITLLDPHRVFVEGSTALEGRDLTAPDAIRPAMALLIGMLAAKGQSILRNIYNIERGYEDLVEKLQAIGAKIKREE